ncbi:MAG: hypothetical protein KA362_10780 [Chloroflexi bacterium]|nr:hypothetical protein [Chloroflexota bacterium]
MLSGNGRSAHNSSSLARGWVETAVLPTVHQVYPGGGVGNGRSAHSSSSLSRWWSGKQPFCPQFIKFSQGVGWETAVPRSQLAIGWWGTAVPPILHLSFIAPHVKRRIIAAWMHNLTPSSNSLPTKWAAA